MRHFVSIAALSLASLAAACSSSGGGGVKIIDAPKVVDTGSPDSFACTINSTDKTSLMGGFGLGSAAVKINGDVNTMVTPNQLEAGIAITGFNETDLCVLVELGDAAGVFTTGA